METERLHFIPISRKHSAFFSQFYSSSLLSKYLPKGSPYSDVEISTLLNNRLTHWESFGFGTYILTLKTNSAPIGYCGLEHVHESDMIDIRYGITEGYWGGGLGFEAAKGIRNHGFNDLGMQQIFGAAKHQNLPSLRIMEKLGMIPFNGAQFFDDLSLQFFRITRKQFDALAITL